MVLYFPKRAARTAADRVLIGRLLTGEIARKYWLSH